MLVPVFTLIGWLINALLELPSVVHAAAVGESV
jgi:hypothetical protein